MGDKTDPVSDAEPQLSIAAWSPGHRTTFEERSKDCWCENVKRGANQASDDIIATRSARTASHSSGLSLLCHVLRSLNGC